MPGQPEQLGVLRGDRVGPQDGGAGHRAQDGEVEPEVEQRDHAADLPADAVGQHLAAEVAPGPVHPVAGPPPGVPEHPAPGLHRHREVRDQQADHQRRGPVDPGQHRQQVAGQERQLLGRDHQVAALAVLESLERGLADGEHQLGDDGGAGPGDDGQGVPGEEGAGEQGRGQQPHGGPERGAGGQDGQQRRPEPRGAPAGLGQEVAERTGQPADAEHADQAGQHPQQRVDADVGGAADAGHRDGRARQPQDRQHPRRAVGQHHPDQVAVPHRAQGRSPGRQPAHPRSF